MVSLGGWVGGRVRWRRFLVLLPGVRGPAGGFGQQAATVTITGLRQHAYATTAGTFTLPDFRLRFGGACR